MPVRALRILHAANLRLDATLSVPGPIPDDVRTLLEDATSVALTRIVTSAIEQDADALLITGNTFDAGAGSLAVDVALQQEFRRLEEHGLPVFITPGVLDPASAWEDMPPLPENVTVFLQGNEPGVELTSGSRDLATIVPISAQTGVEAPELDQIRALAARPAKERGFLIGMWIPDASGHRTLSPAGYSSLDFLAAGLAAGTSNLPLTEGHVQVQPGPQGLHAGETGWQGCQVVDVDAAGVIHSRLIPVAPVRWETCKVDYHGVGGHDDLCERMLGLLELLPGYPGEEVRIITWPLEQAMLESAGITSDRDLYVLRESLTELSDQPKQGLRYLHRLEPVWNDVQFPAAVDRELWQDFSTEMDRWTPLEMERLQKLWEQHTGSAATPAGWPADVPWPPVHPERVRRRALQNGRRWFRQTQGGA